MYLTESQAWLPRKYFYSTWQLCCRHARSNSQQHPGYEVTQLPPTWPRSEAYARGLYSSPPDLEPPESLPPWQPCLSQINTQQNCHIIAIEYQLSFCTTTSGPRFASGVHSDTPSFILALQHLYGRLHAWVCSVRFVIRKYSKLMLEAARRGHLVLSSLSTVSMRLRPSNAS